MYYVWAYLGFGLGMWISTLVTRILRKEWAAYRDSAVATVLDGAEKCKRLFGVAGLAGEIMLACVKKHVVVVALTLEGASYLCAWPLDFLCLLKWLVQLCQVRWLNYRVRRAEAQSLKLQQQIAETDWRIALAKRALHKQKEDE